MSYYESDFIDIGDNIYSEFGSSYHLISVIGDLEDKNRLVAMKELVIDLLNVWFTVLDYLDMD